MSQLLTAILLTTLVCGFSAKDEPSHDTALDPIDEFMTEVEDFFFVYEATTPETWYSINDELTMQWALYTYDPALSELYRETYIDEYSLQANVLIVFSAYLQEKYPDAPNLMGMTIRMSLEDLWTIEDAIAGEPRPQYDPENVPLFAALSYQRSVQYQCYQYYLLGYMGEPGLRVSLELQATQLTFLGADSQWSWAVMGDEAVILLKSIRTEEDLPERTLGYVDGFIADWEHGGLRYLYNPYR